MGYKFDPDVDPRAPLDPGDPCPPGWDTVECAGDPSMRSRGFVPRCQWQYSDWEMRELRRAAARRSA